jgi:diguanylate cyclase (GGDEF)-like protein/PAS domain S-box-containing protein
MTTKLKAWLHSPYRWVGAAALLGLLVSGWVYNISQHHEAARLQAHFDHLANDRALRVQGELNQALTALVTVRGFFDASTHISRSEFRLMVSPVLERHPDIMAINWAPHVVNAERASYEKQLRTDGYAQQGIFEVSPNADNPQPAAVRAQYFPVLYSEPIKHNQGAIGIDTYSRSESHAAMARALRDNLQMGSQPLPLVQDPKGRLAVAIYQPAYRPGLPLQTHAQREAAIRGFIILVLRPATTLEGIFKSLTPVGLDTQLFELSAPPLLLHHHYGRLTPPTIRPGEALQRTYPLAMPGRSWALKITATEGFHDRSSSQETLTILISSLMVTALFTLIIWANIRQNLHQSSLAADLQESESRFRQLADNLDAAFWIGTPDWQQVIYISPAYERIWGRTAENLYRRGLDWFDAITEEDRVAVQEQITEAAQPDWQCIQFPPYRIRRPDGLIRWISARAFPIRDEQGQVVRIAGIAEDISDRQSYQQDLEDLAHYDPLTHLPNRRLLADRLSQSLARSHRSGQLLGICMLDLDGFKPVNDTYGHDVGDQLLIEVARRLQEGVRGDDTVARLGGDEFVILLGGLISIKELEETLRRLLHILASPYLLVDQPILVSASIGVTVYPNDSGDADTLLRHADHAMYLAKEAGKNRFILFNPVLEQRENDNRIALSLIQRAIEENQLRLFYQPIVDCRRGLVVGMEALVRWEHPVLGLMGPAEFLPLVDGDDALSRSVGTWVLDNAVRQADDWRQAGLDLPVSVNVFVQQLRDAKFPEQIQSLLAEYPNLPANRICIEILESAALDDFASVTRLIRTCASQGVRFALDDFGTGFSSLTYLRQLPVNTLKIDQSFVRDMLHDPNDLTIVEGVIGLGTAFRHQVIAEGVESADHALMLMEIGCYLVQGYGIAKPMPGAETLAWIQQFKPDPRWLKNAAQRLSHDDFQLALADVNHRQWLASLRNWMNLAPAQRGPAPQMDGHECNFGHWYFGEGQNRYGHLPEYRAAESLHERIHRLAQQLVHLVEHDNIAASRAAEAELMDTADEFRDTLVHIRSAVKYTDASQ